MGGAVVTTQSFALGSRPWMGPAGGLFFALFTLVPLGLLLLLWLLLARSTFLQGDDMERPSRVAQLYGYTVCLIAVADRIERVRFQAQRAIATSALSLILAIALFAIHWRWLRPRSDIGSMPGEPTGVVR